MPPKKSAPIETSILPGNSAAAQQQKANSGGIADYELPKTSLTKLAKGSIPDNVKMQQDVVLALLRSSTMFINYLSAASHDQALARSGKSITASDVIKAITELDFGPADALVPLLEVELAAYRKNVQNAKAQKQAAKSAAAGGATAGGSVKGKRRKSGVETDGGDITMDGEDEGEGEGGEDDDDEEEEDDEDRVEGQGARRASSDGHAGGGHQQSGAHTSDMDDDGAT